MSISVRADTSTRAGVRVRWLFAITILFIPVELAIAFFATEPYPALFQPAFSGSPQVGHEAIVPRPFVTITFDSGEEEDLDFTEIIPSREILGSSLIAAGYGTTERANSPENLAFLDDRFAVLFPGRTVASVLIDWRELDIDVATGEQVSSRSTKKVVIDMSGAR